MSEVLKGGWMEEKRKNRLPVGYNDEFDHEDLGYFTKTFLLFKGCPMKSGWIKGWKHQVGLADGHDDQGRPHPATINLPGVQSFSKRISQSLLYSISKEKAMKPVLFVISMKNYKTFHGFRLTDNKYTAHEDDQEYLLMEGVGVQVLKVEEIHIKTTNWI